MSTIEELLRGGNPRTLHGVTRVIDDVLHDPSRCGELVRAMAHDDAIVRMRAADAAEKISRTNPELIEPYKAQLLQIAASTEQPSLRWHLAQTITRLSLDGDERRGAVTIFKRYLGDPSAIVKTCAMQALADIALADALLRRSVVPALQKATDTGTAAMRSRGKRLLEALESRAAGKARRS